ncbi:Protein PBDC1 [Vanrija pseudolonga]|uniref:Protein PBDC1 n=1 Tax=Vanrija pseudolonga TaxID=143232 RepID=A0AAF0YI05_9TREE|nr:Protein PBDC1 [Vanrija pseudolonga]
MSAITNINEFDPNKADNAEEIEMQWSVKTVEHMEAYENLITSTDPKTLKLSSDDDAIHADLLAKFPEFRDHANLRNLDENWLKSKEGKERWREWLASYEQSIPDYNFGTMLRQHSDQLYSEHNAILVLRAQFVAIEIARNRAGLNEKVYHEAQAAKKA